MTVFCALRRTMIHWRKFKKEDDYLRNLSFEEQELDNRESFAIIGVDPRKNHFILITYNHRKDLFHDIFTPLGGCSKVTPTVFMKLDAFVFPIKGSKHSCVDAYCHRCYWSALRCLNLPFIYNEDMNINRFIVHGV